MRGIYEDGLRWYDIHTKFQDNLFRHSSILSVLPQQFERLQRWYYR
jgi:hypothetical protein